MLLSQTAGTNVKVAAVPPDGIALPMLRKLLKLNSTDSVITPLDTVHDSVSEASALQYTGVGTYPPATTAGPWMYMT